MKGDGTLNTKNDLAKRIDKAIKYFTTAISGFNSHSFIDEYGTEYSASEIKKFLYQKLNEDPAYKNFINTLS